MAQAAPGPSLATWNLTLRVRNVELCQHPRPYSTQHTAGTLQFGSAMAGAPSWTLTAAVPIHLDKELVANGAAGLYTVGPSVLRLLRQLMANGAGLYTVAPSVLRLLRQLHRESVLTYPTVSPSQEGAYEFDETNVLRWLDSVVFCATWRRRRRFFSGCAAAVVLCQARAGHIVEVSPTAPIGAVEHPPLPLRKRGGQRWHAKRAVGGDGYASHNCAPEVAGSGLLV